MRRLSVSVLFVALLIGVLMGCDPAQAHRPYAIEEGTFQSADGRPLTLERYYGDGIFFADPGRGQFRDERGAVVAHTWVATGVTTFCPSLAYCWVFLYGRLSPLPTALRLDPAAIAWQAPVLPNVYPEEEWDKPPVAFVDDDRISIAVLGLFMMGVQNALGIAIAGPVWIGLLSVPIGIRWVWRRQSSTAFRLAAGLVLIATGLALGFTLLATGFVMIAYFGYPLPALVGLLIALWMAWTTIRWKFRRMAPVAEPKIGLP